MNAVPIRLGVVGATGRMGLSVLRAATEAGLTVAAAVSSEHIGRDIGELIGLTATGVTVASDMKAVPLVDAIIDFSTPAGVVAACTWAKDAKVALVSGTTSLDAAAIRALEDAASTAPVLWEPNMSTGVHVLSMLVELAAQTLGMEFDVEIVEAHHRRKVDSPSGTADRLADVVRAARQDLAVVHGRHGIVGARKPTELGMHVVRGGDVIGDHTVMFLGEGERIELTHRATDRGLFARGAIRAARALVGKPAGRYTMRDMLEAPSAAAKGP